METLFVVIMSFGIVFGPFPGQTVDKTIELPMIYDSTTPIWRRCDDKA